MEKVEKYALALQGVDTEHAVGAQVLPDQDRKHPVRECTRADVHPREKSGIYSNVACNAVNNHRRA